jgi:spore coat polysaccharide biosynthesis predicted glycosyltransferase SpsG
LPNNTKIDWVTGPFSISPKFPKDSSVNFVEHVSPPSLGILMSQAKVAATIYGVSFYELIASNVPTVVFSPYEDKNKRELDEIKNLGIALVAKDVNEATILLRDLIVDQSLQKTLSLRAAKTISKYSGERFAEEIDLLLRIGN